MLSFSVTLPATRAAVVYLHPAVVACGRVVLAGTLAATLLIVTRQSPPERRYWKSFAIVILSVVLGVPILFAWGMHGVPAAHGAVVLALLPLATALTGALRDGERPSRRFWLASIVGSGAVVVFAKFSGAGSIQMGDVFLLLSVIASAVGYAEGACLTRVFPGWVVTSWSAAIGTPIMAIPLALAVKHHGFAAAPLSAWCGFIYIGAVSQFSGLFAWYKGLATGGIARIGQLQLLQPFCTLMFSALLLRESVTPGMVVAAVVVVASVAVSRNAVIKTRDRCVASERA